mgnify:CR=1 FL=1
MRLLIFGYGFSGRQFARRLASKGWTVAATCRSADGRARIEADAFEAINLDDPVELAGALQTARALLITPPPATDGCPGLAALKPELSKTRSALKWIGYLSTTGVYGDRKGRWVSEQSPLAPVSPEGARRVDAERQWLELADELDLTVTVFRLPGIYGPGRSAFDRLRDGRARRITAPGQVFSRIHVVDLAAGLEASISNPRAGGIYNLCDDEPAPNSDVIAYAAGLLGIEPPPAVRLQDADLSPVALRFYLESKRVSNALAKAELGWRPAFPTYREGLASILTSGG